MSRGIRVLLVEDNEDERKELNARLTQSGYVVQAFERGEEAVKHVARLLAGGQESGESAAGELPELAILDIELPGINGLETLSQIKAQAPGIEAVMLTAIDKGKSGFDAHARGAYDFVEKSYDSRRLMAALKRAGEAVALRSQVRALELGVGPDAIVGESPALRKVLETANRVAPSSAKVILTGENGTGKDLIARYIHARSRRAGKPFVKLNCAAIPKDLVESELFGHEKGSFTGALQSKKGKFELADGGSLLLDEIGDLGTDAQAKVLRAIETGEIEHVGGQRPLTVDVRLIAATNHDLPTEVREGRFREDLYFRLNVVPVRVPPLRERVEDVPLLAEHFLSRFAETEGLPKKELSPEALDALRGYAWPGNVRELRNLMERAAVLVEGPRIGAADLEPWLERDESGAEGSPVATEPGAEGLRDEMDRYEANAIRRELEAAKWNVTQAAARLGLDRTNLHRKMRKFGIGRHEEEVE